MRTRARDRAGYVNLRSEVNVRLQSSHLRGESPGILTSVPQSTAQSSEKSYREGSCKASWPYRSIHAHEHRVNIVHNRDRRPSFYQLIKLAKDRNRMNTLRSNEELVNSTPRLLQSMQEGATSGQSFLDIKVKLTSASCPWPELMKADRVNGMRRKTAVAEARIL